MKKSDPGSILKDLILEKEAERIIAGKELKEQFHLVHESLKPANIIKNTFKGMFSALDLKGNIVNAAIGLTTGFAAKKMFTGGSKNPLKRLAGIIVEIAVTRAVTQNSDVIKSVGGFIFKSIFKRKEPAAEKSAEPTC